MKLSIFSFFLISLFIFTPTTKAWERHQTLMPWILKGLPKKIRKKLDGNYRAPCPDKDRRVIDQLIFELQLNPEGLHIPSEGESCKGLLPVKLWDVLTGISVDQPSQGMDRNLSNAADLKGDRKWFGGSKSGEFRHKYYAGWNPQNPLMTFQIPMHSIGKAHERVDETARRAFKFIENKETVWGVKILAWSLHYLQQLSQPTRVAQIPYYEMALWHYLFSWPPQKGIKLFQNESFRTLANYEVAYERYVYRQLQKGLNSPFVDCLSNPKRDRDEKFDSPYELAIQVARRSRKLAPQIGKLVYTLFGPDLKKRYFDLKKNKGVVSYDGVMKSSTLEPVRAKLDKATCEALEIAADGSRRLLKWAFQ